MYVIKLILKVYTLPEIHFKIGGMSGGEHLAAGGHALEVSLLAARFSQQLLVQSILQYQLETRQE